MYKIELTKKEREELEELLERKIEEVGNGDYNDEDKEQGKYLVFLDRIWAKIDKRSV